MQAIKKVFSHDDNHTAGSHGHADSAASGNGSAAQQQGAHHGTTGTAAEHIVEKATPPQAHPQPTERTHLNQEQASQAEHDHKHLAPVVREC